MYFFSPCAHHPRPQGGRLCARSLLIEPSPVAVDGIGLESGSSPNSQPSTAHPLTLPDQKWDSGVLQSPSKLEITTQLLPSSTLYALKLPRPPNHMSMRTNHPTTWGAGEIFPFESLITFHRISLSQSRWSHSTQSGRKYPETCLFPPRRQIDRWRGIGGSNFDLLTRVYPLHLIGHNFPQDQFKPVPMVSFDSEWPKTPRNMFISPSSAN